MEAKTIVGAQAVEFQGLLGGLYHERNQCILCRFASLSFSVSLSLSTAFPTLYSSSFLTVSVGPLILLPLHCNVLMAPLGPLSTSKLFLLQILYKLSLQTALFSPRFSIPTPESY